MGIESKLLQKLPYGSYFYDLPPNDDNIVYSNYNGLFITDFAGSFNIRFSEQGGRSSYSSDRNWIAFSKWVSDNDRNIVITKIKTDGSLFVQLTTQIKIATSQFFEQ